MLRNLDTLAPHAGALLRHIDALLTLPLPLTLTVTLPNPYPYPYPYPNPNPNPNLPLTNHEQDSAVLAFLRQICEGLRGQGILEHSLLQ